MDGEEGELEAVGDAGLVVDAAEIVFDDLLLGAELRGDVLGNQLKWWRKQLDGAPPVLDLPADHSRPATQTFRGACEWLKIPASISDKLNVLGQSGGFTPYMIFLAAFQALIHRYTGQEDIVLGSPVAGRTRASRAPSNQPTVLPKGTNT